MKNYSKHTKDVNDFLEILSKDHHRVAEGFTAIHKAASEDGVISSKHKELIALAIAITIRCEGCIACHIKTALEQSASEKEIIETIGVAIAMGGGPSVVYGEKAYKAMKEFKATLTI